MTTVDDQVAEAAQRFEAFHGRPPRRNEIGAMTIDSPGAALKIGKVQAITYERLSEKGQPYQHKFAKKAQPDLVVSYDGDQGYIVGGDYRFTGRGFEDHKKGEDDMPGSLIMMNPVGRSVANPFFTTRKKRAKVSKKRARKNPFHHKAKRHRRRTRRNPISSRARAALSGRSGLGGGGGGIEGMIMPVAIGAAGAVAFGLAWNQISTSLPTSLQSGTTAQIAQVAAALGFGYVVGMVAGKRTGMLVGMGGAIVAAVNLLSGVVSPTTAATTATDTSLNRYVSRRTPVGYIGTRRGVGAYVAGARRGVGYPNPAFVTRV